MTAANKVYVVVFAAKGLPVTPMQLNEFITNNKNIIRWWNYIPLCYVFISNMNSSDLTDMFGKFLENLSADFILAEIDVENVEGWLPDDAWEAYRRDIERVALGLL